MLDNICICKICGEECRSIRHLSAHIQIKEQMKLKDYYDKFIKNTEDGICPCCGKNTEFLSLTHGYNKHCSKECLAKTRGEKNSKRMKIYFSNKENRKQQSNKIKKSKNHKKACSSIEFKNKMSVIRTDAYQDKDYAEKMNKASHNENWKKSVTSKEFREHASKINTKRILNGEVFKLYKYNNEWFNSKPEHAFYIYLKDHKIKFEHEKDKLPYYFENIKHYYIPDFKVFNTYVEIKGLHLMKQLLIPNTFEHAKYKCMVENKVHIITDYSKYEKYVENKYGLNFFEQYKV